MTNHGQHSLPTAAILQGSHSPHRPQLGASKCWDVITVTLCQSLVQVPEDARSALLKRVRDLELHLAHGCPPLLHCKPAIAPVVTAPARDLATEPDATVSSNHGQHTSPQLRFYRAQTAPIAHSSEQAVRLVSRQAL